MGFRYTNLGTKVSTEPAKAAEELIELYVKHGGNQTQIVKELGIDYRTLTRWLARLLEAGHDVRTQAMEKIELAQQQAEQTGGRPPPEPPKAGRRPKSRKPT